MGKMCAVFGCGTNSCHKTGISTFAFPKEPPSIRRAWINFVKTSRKNFSVPTSYNVICALHFTPCCFEDQFTADLRALSGYSRRGILTKDAVPTLLTEKCEAAMKRKTMYEKRWWGSEIYKGCDTERDSKGETMYEENVSEGR